MTEGFVSCGGCHHRADKHRSGHRRAQSSSGCQTLPRIWVNTPMVCSAEGGAAAGVQPGQGPAQGVCTAPLARQGSGGLSSMLHKLVDLLVSTGDKWPGALFWSSQSCNKGEDPVSAAVELTPSKEKLHSLAHNNKAQSRPCSDETLSMGGQEPL